MNRPIRKFDFILLSPWEYYFQYWWPIILIGLIGSVAFSRFLVDILRPTDFFQSYNEFTMEMDGMRGEVGITVSTLTCINVALNCVLYKCSKWVMTCKEKSFNLLFEKVERSFFDNHCNDDELDEDIAKEYFTYKAAKKAQKILNANIVKNKEARAQEQERESEEWANKEAKKKLEKEQKKKSKRRGA